jgi:hypothetical protein
VQVRTPETVRLSKLLATTGVTAINIRDSLRISGIITEQIGTVAWLAQPPLYELTHPTPLDRCPTVRQEEPKTILPPDCPTHRPPDLPRRE